MIKNALIFGLLVIAFASLDHPCYGLEWKKLHEMADQEAFLKIEAEATKNPGSLEALYALALADLNLYRVNEAEEIFRKMLRFEPKSIEAKWGLADVFRRRHQLGQCQSLLEEIIKADPEFSPAYVSLGYMLFDKKDYERSIRLAMKVIRQGRGAVDLTNYTRAYLIIGGAKGMLADEGGPFSKVYNGMQILAYFKKAEKLQPDSAGVLFGLGSFYLLAPSLAGGDKNKGMRYLEKTIKVDPHFTDAYARLAQAYLMKGDRDQYRHYLDKAFELDPLNELAQRVKAMKS